MWRNDIFAIWVWTIPDLFPDECFCWELIHPCPFPISITRLKSSVYYHVLHIQKPTADHKRMSFKNGAPESHRWVRSWRCIHFHWTWRWNCTCCIYVLIKLQISCFSMVFIVYEKKILHLYILNIKLANADMCTLQE